MPHWPSSSPARWRSAERWSTGFYAVTGAVRPAQEVYGVEEIALLACAPEKVLCEFIVNGNDY
ncbi:hypothetical protein EMIT0194P_150105 [Pseudomonas serbica]